MFYANLWVKHCTYDELFFLNSMIDGVPINFSLQTFCNAFQMKNKGLDKFDVYGWDTEAYGLTEELVKTELRYLPSKKLPQMPLVNKVLLGIVTSCINGKATRNPSNLNFMSLIVF